MTRVRVHACTHTGAPPLTFALVSLQPLLAGGSAKQLGF